MFEQISQYAVIVSYNDINDRTEMGECIFYHIQNCTSLHTFRAPLKVLWEIMFLCFLFPLIFSITLLSGLLVEEHTNNALRDATDDESITVRGVISPSG